MKLTIKLLFICLLGFLHWFFGNLYDTLILTPNVLLADDQVAMLGIVWRLFSVSPPYYYYLPWGPLSIGLVVYLWFRLRRTNSVQVRRWITYATGFAISAGVVTWYIIVHYNLTLWVGSGQYSATELSALIRENTVVALFQIGLVGATVYCLYRTTRLVVPAYFEARSAVSQSVL
ncbi:hypothetical protein [Spirosoma spitsbergense]|uniref:hypothetical protein n=1 Tax=Spirosoma spitsbergense TaxID=431554 RepID=UPI000363ECBB|nr:hypothetical protein [Spirosoma spitsbergense]